MHSRESARVVRQILPAAQGIVARHAVPRLQNLRSSSWSRSISGKPWGKTPTFLSPAAFLMGVGWRKVHRNGTTDSGQSHGDSTSFGAIRGLCLVANVNVQHTFLDTQLDQVACVELCQKPWLALCYKYHWNHCCLEWRWPRINRPARSIIGTIAIARISNISVSSAWACISGLQKNTKKLVQV